MKFDWTLEHHATFLHLKEAVVQAPILHYPNPNKKYIVYTDTSDDPCGAQLSQDHNGNGAPLNKRLLAYTMASPNGITTYKVLTSLLETTINPKHISLMERTLIIKSIDGVWNLPHITSPLSGFLEPEIKQQIASPD